jgi:hypothetical protein
MKLNYPLLGVFLNRLNRRILGLDVNLISHINLVKPFRGVLFHGFDFFLKQINLFFLTLNHLPILILGSYSNLFLGLKQSPEILPLRALTTLQRLYNLTVINELSIFRIRNQ